MLLAFLLAAPAPTGTWTFLHPVPMPALVDKTACRDGGGVWTEGMCQKEDVADTIVVEPANDGTWRVQVTTVTSNERTCTFDGVGELVRGELVATQRVKLQGHGTVTCTVNLSFRGDRATATVVDPTPCANLCGPRGSLDVEGATR